jgi:hypothetical protein
VEYVFERLCNTHILYGSATTTSQPGWNFNLGLHSESQSLNTIPGGLDSKHLWEETVPKLI